MEKKSYISPCMDQLVIMPEAILASSTTETSEVTGLSPEPWKEGNMDWWN